MPAACILNLYGLPGSGKSTLAGQLCDYLSTEADSVSAVVVSSDDAYEDVSGGADRWSPETWRSAQHLASEKAADFLRTASDAQKSALVIVDDVQHLRSMRKNWRTLARSMCCTYIGVHVYEEVAVCETRVLGRSKAVNAIPPDVMRRICAEFEDESTQDLNAVVPGCAAGGSTSQPLLDDALVNVHFHQRGFLSLNLQPSKLSECDRALPAMLWSIVQVAISRGPLPPPLPPMKLFTIKGEVSRKHLIDLCTRRVVGNVVKNYVNRREASQKLLSMRKEFLNEADEMDELSIDDVEEQFRRRCVVDTD